MLNLRKAPESFETVPREKRRVLIVEDDLDLNALLQQVLHTIDPEIQIDWTTTAEDAILRVQQACKHSNHYPYDLMIADIYLEGNSTGLDFWETCRDVCPDVPLMITSALGLDKFFSTLGSETISPPYLPKPFSIGECRQFLEGMLQYSPRQKLKAVA